MYADFYGLKEMPFSLTPDSRFLFLSFAHKEALSHLLYGIRGRKGFILITGEIGAGKTTLCRALLNELGPDTEVAFVMNTFVTERQLLGSIVYDLMAECRGRTKKDMIEQLNGFLLRSKSEGKNVIILIDEAQNLSPKVMEQIRMLSNLETERDKLLQIILVGQPEVREILAMPRMRQLNQRIAVRYHLRPLSRRETAEYIRHRLEVAGSKDGLRFSRWAVDRIYRYSAGTPRLINIVCDRALLIGYVKGKMRIGSWIIRRAHFELSGRRRLRMSRKNHFLAMSVSPKRVIMATLAAAIVFAALLGWANRERLIVDARSVETQVREAAVRPEAAGGVKAAPREPPKPAPVPKEEAGGEEAREPAAIPPDVLAAERLLSLWGYDEPVSKNDSLEGLVGRSGLKAVVSWAALPYILKVDLPCILEVGRDYYVLEGLDGDTAICWVGGEKVSIPLAELGRVWNGRAIIVNRRADSRDPLLHVSMRGDDVLDTQAGLSRLNYYSGDATGHYDEATKEAVERFQADLGINADGITGPETRLALWSMLAGRGVPRLRSLQAGEAVQEVQAGQAQGTGR